MSRIILLDASPLGIISNPRFSTQTLDCHRWAKERLASGAQIVIPEVREDSFVFRSGQGILL
jgi:hypothetical protein